MEENEKIRFFQPNAAQARWIAEISRRGAYIVVNASGNGAGKTYGMVAVLGAFLWPDLAPGCFPRDVLVKPGRPKRARIISTPKELEDIGSLQTTIAQLWPQGRYDPQKGGRSFYSQYSTDTGWVLDLMSYEQAVSEFAGPNIGLLCFNEPMPKPIWDESIARTRKGGLILAAMTSLRDNPWVVDGLLGKANGDDIRVVYGDIEDNCKQHGANGTLEHSDIDRLLMQYDPDERESRKTGKPLRFSGRIYKTFNRDVHVAKEVFKVPSDEFTSLYMSVDPAIGKPFACIWAYVDRYGVINIFDEYPATDFEGAKDSNLTVRDYAAIFKRKEEGKPVDRIIDRHFANHRMDVGGRSLKEEFGDAGCDFMDSYSDGSGDLNEVETGILAVKAYLRYNTQAPLSSTNRPKLRISPNCTNTIKAFERWTRDPDTHKPDEHFKDHMDCVRYLCKAEPRYEPPKNWGNRREPYYGVGK